MSASNPKCHKKKCLCATCKYVCSVCAVSGKCTDKECTQGKKKCNMYKEV